MTISEALHKTPVSPIDAEILLSYALGKDRSWILAHPEKPLTETQKSTFKDFLNRRSSGEPLAYITGKKEFYGRLFNVNQSVLIPRPSTEGLIDLTLNFLRSHKDEVREVDTGIVCISKYLNKYSNVQTIIDVGTGSGCIAVTLTLELPAIRLIATDSSTGALEVAKTNADRLGASNRIEFRKGKNLKPVENLKEPFILVSNPPYVPQNEKIQKEVQLEPKEALFAGEDGMDVLKPLVKAARNHPFCCGFVLECKKEQTSLLFR